MTYGVGDVTTTERTTATLGEAIALYVAFSPIFIGLILAGENPGSYIEKPWIIKCLLGTVTLGYLVLGVFYLR